MKHAVFLIILIYLSFNEIGAQDSSLVKGFRNPGIESRPRAYWNWLNGDVSPAGLTRDLEEAKDKGLGGLLIWDTEAMRNPDGIVPAGPTFLENESVRAIHHAMDEAGRLNLDLGLVCASGWNSGGSWVTPEMASKNLFASEILVTGPGQGNHRVPFPVVPSNCPKGKNGLPLWYIEVAVLAWPWSEDKHIPNLTDVVNLSGRFRNGELVWNPPSGTWQVVRFVCTNNGQQLIAASPNSKGFFIDFLDPAATKFHFKYIFDQLGIRSGGKSGSPLKSLDDDSMELHEGIQWTTRFREWFRKKNGYDPVPWLPVLMGWNITDQTVSERFKYDYRKTVSDFLIESHYKTGSEICAEYDLNLTAEAGGPGPPFWETCPVDALKALGNVGIPRGEFWLGNPRNLFLVKEIASAAHIYGKKYVDAESWTTWHRWRDGPFTLKKLVDRAFCEGLNRITYHGFSNSPPEFGFPGRTYHAGLDMNPRITWWPKARPFMDYLARCCYMLQQGKYVADVAYYYGDQAPNFWPFYHNVPEKPAIDGLGRGYEYDVVNTDVILNRMSVNNGRITLPDGMSYRILVLPDKKDIPLEVLRKLEKLISEGATVIGPKPSEVPGLNNYKKETEILHELAGKIWGDCNGTTIKVNKYGKGRIVWGFSPEQWLSHESVRPDFACENPELASGFDFIHRKTSLSEIYFVVNKTQALLKADCFFRVKDGLPQTWDPVTGEIKGQFIFKQEQEGIRLPLLLPPGESLFVVFNRGALTPGFHSFEKAEGNSTENIPDGQVVAIDSGSVTVQCWQNGSYLLTGNKNQQTRVLAENIPAPEEFGGEWKLEFNPLWGAPPEVTLPGLSSWSDHTDEGVKYYSGTGTYRKTFALQAHWLKPGRKVYLDLGEVREVAEVYVNGHSAGVLWKPPYRTDITPFLQSGTNELKVEVVNLWINRLTGDMNLPADKRFTKTNILSDGATPKVPAEPWHTEPAGLLGPVRLLPSDQITVKIQK